MMKTILYIATSLDGYIAKPDGDLDWLTSMPAPADGDYGYSELLSSIGTLIMGRKTYDQLIGFGIDWPYKGLETYVVTSNRDMRLQSPDTYALTEDLDAFMRDLKGRSTKNIWLVGGGQLVGEFLRLKLLDQMIISIIPRIIGEGISLFSGRHPESEWKLTGSEAFDTGVVSLTYEIVR